MSDVFELKLPATSANLGPAFDAAGLAFNLGLRVRADVASGGEDTVTATGRDAAICGDARDHLILKVYRRLLERENRRAPALALALDNAIPIGKGCGSSAAARLAGVALASHFGELDWDAQRVFEEAAVLEGHPDNVAACWWGGLVVSRQSKDAIDWLRVPAAAAWPLLLAVPTAPLSTEEARSVLPTQLSRADAVANLQNALFFMQAWQQGRGDLLAGALDDLWHQP